MKEYSRQNLDQIGEEVNLNYEIVKIKIEREDKKEVVGFLLKILRDLSPEHFYFFKNNLRHSFLTGVGMEYVLIQSLSEAKPMCLIGKRVIGTNAFIYPFWVRDSTDEVSKEEYIFGRGISFLATGLTFHLLPFEGKKVYTFSETDVKEVNYVLDVGFPYSFDEKKIEDSELVEMYLKKFLPEELVASTKEQSWESLKEESFFKKIRWNRDIDAYVNLRSLMQEVEVSWVKNVIRSEFELKKSLTKTKRV